MPRPKTPTVKAQPHVAIIGAGIAGITCARTLAQAGMRVTVFEKSRGCGGRMSTRRSPFGDFDHGAQYFTMRDPRFEAALATTAQTIKRWSANTVRVMDTNGQVLATTGNPSDAHWVPVPGMNALVKAWAAPLQDGTLKGCNVVLQTRIVKLQQQG
ncbi:MAG: FAD-dependent oxidoreductase, partial [Burkholderiaceae bacterium]|nr:FAD-dependent oxidoreductase [Burkholderiaceae bacterium]